MISVTSYVCTIQDNSDILIWYTPPFLNKYTYQIVPTLPQNKNKILIMYMTELSDEKQKQMVTSMSFSHLVESCHYIIFNQFPHHYLGIWRFGFPENKITIILINSLGVMHPVIRTNNNS